jgi:hypothetical protein
MTLLKTKLKLSSIHLIAVIALYGCSDGEVQNIGTNETEEFISGGVASSVGASTSSGNTVTVMPDIVEVNIIVAAEDWDTSDADYDENVMPFYGAGNRTSILGDGHSGAFPTNTQYPAQFNFTYPANNFQLSTANLIVDTAKDSSDTEGIWIDKTFTGIPPSVNASQDTTNMWAEVGSTYSPANTAYNHYYVENGFLNYVIDKRNTFDFDAREALKDPALSGDDQDQAAYNLLLENLQDGNLKIVLGDDSPIYKGTLVISGFTIASETLSCTTTPTYTMSNSLLHRDGGTTASVFASPCDTLNSTDACDSTRFYFEQTFPKVKDENITISSTSITFSDASAQGNGGGSNIVVDRTNGTDPVAIIISGLGLAEAGFNKADADSSVEWLSDFDIGTAIGLDSIAGNQNNLTIDLVSLFGADRVKEKMLEGSLNVELAGFKITGSGDTSARSFRAQQAGPEINIAGTYFTEICDVEDNPDSPLSQTGLDAVVVDDGQSPTINSLQVSEITNNSAKIVWLSSEHASSQVHYGVASVAENSTALSTSAVTFHEVTLTGLNNYTVYQIQVESVDVGGNGVTSNIIEFITKR